jgi:hypothetical protein
MRGQFAAAIAILCLVATQASAQTATGVGVGVSNSSSSSRSGAVAVGGGLGVGTGGTGGTSSATITNTTPANTTSNITENQNLSGTQTLRNVPAVFAPGLTAAGLETCLGSVSGGGSIVGFGATFGTTIPDPGCAARLDARTLWSFGLRRAAIARLCLMEEIRRSMPDVCQHYVYVQQQLPAVAKADAGTAPAYAGGPVEVIDQKGNHRICNDLDVNKHRCRAWAQQMAAAH